EEAYIVGLIVKEKPLRNNDGRLKDKRIAIRQDIPTTLKKADVLAEEMGHYFTSVGRIVEQDETKSVKQERAARLWGYNKRIGLNGIINAFKAHCESLYDMAEFLNVSEDTLAEAIEYYRQIYGTGTMVDNYFLQFEPNLQVHTLMTVK
ncbi:hypothetical protein, partial [Serratia marcescens]|uniref:hypothetical protein n=1 Tax=Serratia marcescens TaxID=615 RepID=UPI001CA34C79